MKVIDAHIPITEVTVFEDRAHVVRRGLVQFPEGPSRIQLRELAPTLVDKTVAVSVLGPVDVQRVRVTRHHGVGQSAPTSENRSAAHAEADRLETEAEGIDKAIALTLREIAEDAAAGRADRKRWSAAWSRLFAHAKQARGAWDRARAGSVSTADDVELGTDRPLATLELELQSADAGPHPIQIDYVVPNAAWRPNHRLQVMRSDDPDGEWSLSFEINARVWQNTGEDWSEASLFLSTQRTTMSVGPPELQSDLLEAERSSRPPPASARNAPPSELAVDVALLPDDGGKTQRFAAARTTIRSTGEPHLVRIDAFADATRPAWVMRAGEAFEGVLRIAVANRGKHPILAGPVDVISDGGLVTRTSVGHVEPGAPFELTWSQDDTLRIHRSEHAESMEGKKSRSRQTTHAVELVVSNLGGHERTVRIEDGIPVPGVKYASVEYDADASTSPSHPDDAGRLWWLVALPPYGHHTVRFRYSTVDARGE